MERRTECVEIFAPPASSERELGIVITDHSGAVRACQGFAAGPGDFGENVQVVGSPLGGELTSLAFEIWWPVPEVCDYMPVELEIWRTDDGLFVHIDRKAVVDLAQGCRAVTGRQGIAVNLGEPIMASSVETVLTTEGVATSVVDMPGAAMTWTLSLVPGRVEYAVGERIEIEAILAYEGDANPDTRGLGQRARRLQHRPARRKPVHGRADDR